MRFATMKSSIPKDARAGEEKTSAVVLQDGRATVIDYYEKHKGEFQSKVDAAYRIYEQRLVPYKYSTIYTWLDRHIRKIAQ